MNSTKLLFSLVFTLVSLSVFGQQQPEQPQLQTNQVMLLPGSDSIVGGVFNGEKVNKVYGKVAFRQKETYLYADSVYQYRDRNVLEAYGNVRINNQADTVTMTGNQGTYNGTTRTARMTGNVVMKDPRMTLTTPSLDYDMNTRTAVYTEGGTIVDPENRLQSQRGSYNTATKMFTFQQDVKVFTKDYNITAENMQYNTGSKIVYFQGPTVIKGQQGDLYAEEGTYNTLTKISNFGRNAYILTPEYRLGGDKLYYDQNLGYGFAQQNVTLKSLKDNITVRGQEGRYWRERGVAKVYGNPVMETVMDNDTLYMAADTLVSREAKTPGMASLLLAYHDVRIYKKDLQGKCDSLSYNRTDSVMYMNQKPVLWNDKSQLVGDTIRMHLRNKTIDKLYLFSNAFITSEDTIQNYNQVKGRDMVASFQEGDIRRVDVNGNGESIYFALEGDTVVTGMNKAICSNMVLKFGDNKLKTISFLIQPDASFIPPHELQEDQKRLEGFSWLADLRPTKAAVLGKRPPAEAKPATAAAKTPTEGEAPAKAEKPEKNKK
ncbi:LPS export ABC transporter periplasmic protein LptC [Pontibacter sp. 172403-2]|uniref:OstA-like protein n=1 Tax=Pontibacter rufus TaxID=2791028 RepID=UPI0018AFC9D4|nr:OstA-like protein [Pontibacter sp. 172403-2]MBF9252080.1 LPS export ABC transporter periplasmic protein LptC [Pontibacter sp. 172403-2]